MLLPAVFDCGRSCLSSLIANVPVVAGILRVASGQMPTARARLARGRLSVTLVLGIRKFATSSFGAGFAQQRTTTWLGHMIRSHPHTTTALLTVEDADEALGGGRPGLA